MPVEIERKFLVHDSSALAGLKGVSVVQGYVSITPVVRVRIAGDKSFLTLKGPQQGLTRPEFEYEIPLDEAQELLETLCGLRLLRKTRYHVPAGRHVFEVDVFHGNLEGLVLAEVELASEAEAVDLPSWLGREVSDDTRYSNSTLAVSQIVPL